MNKLLIVLLAVCLVSVHAFVKRDAPADQKDVAKDLQNQLQDLGKQLESFLNQENIKKGLDSAVNTVKQSLNGEELKKQFNGIVDAISKAVENVPSGQATAAPQKS